MSQHITQSDIAFYKTKVYAKYGVDLPEAFARDLLAYTFELAAQHQKLQAELDAERAKTDTSTRTQRGKTAGRK